MSLDSRHSSLHISYPSTLSNNFYQRSLSTTRPLSNRSGNHQATSSSTDKHAPQSSSTSGIGRKVANSLELFKESSSNEDVTLETSSASRKPSSSSKADSVPEPSFEFFKRSEWPDRETAARRRRSITVFEKVMTRDDNASSETKSYQGQEFKPLVREGDLLHRPKDPTNKKDDSRGRRRDRKNIRSVVDDRSSLPTAFNINYGRQLSSPAQRTYPLSPSPSRSPASRLALSSSSKHRETTPTCLERTGSTSSSHQAKSAEPLPPVQPISSLWSTDEESAWETASATTSNSTLSANDLSSSQVSAIPASSLHSPVDYNDPVTQHSLVSFASRMGPREVDDDPEFDDEDQLPHVPLRPFRNQVGGHSAIYKFTKRAVCKVRPRYSSMVVFSLL